MLVDAETPSYTKVKLYNWLGSSYSLQENGTGVQFPYALKNNKKAFVGSAWVQNSS